MPLLRQHQQEILSFLVTFVPIVAVLKLNQFLFFYFDTSPAVILMPTGIGLAAAYLGGSRMWVPIAAAWFLGLLTSPSHPTALVIVVGAVAYALQAVLGGYTLKRFGFLGTLTRTRSALVLIGTALVVSTVAPSFVSLAQWLSDSLTASIWTTWSRAWAGSVMSIMIFTPLITTWFKRHPAQSVKTIIESAAAIVVLIAAVYVTFWTKLPQVNVFIVLYALFATLFWIGLRLPPRVVTLALFLVAFFGMAGSIIARPFEGALNVQLLADELFVVLIAPIFFILTALVEERRISAQQAQARAEELEEANRALSHDDQAKNEFLATLAHELRNPMAPVMSSLELMKLKAQELNRPDLLELVEIADTHTRTLRHLLDDLLDISRISRHTFSLRKESVELLPIVEQAQRTVRTLYQSKKHALTVSTYEAPLWIEADPLRLEQILVNVLSNAAKYTEPGGRVELSVVYDQEKGLRFSVKDNGIGIERHMLDTIFEPFMQSNDSGTGLGIGLSLSRRLVELHGGQIWAESEGLGKGSDFIVVLPALLVQRPPEVSTGRRRDLTFGGEKKSARAHSILIVDDNQAAADGLRKLLEHNGHTVSVTYDGYSAISEIRKTEAQTVLLDIGLPGMDGYAVARRLRQTYAHSPLLLVALTGYGQAEDKAKAYEAGFNYHLTKPVSIADIEAILAKNA